MDSACTQNQKWFIGNVLRNALLDDEDIVEKVGDKIYPLVAAENTKGDFIVYSREKYSKSESKIGVYNDECSVAFVAVSDSYYDAVELASLIDNALTGTHFLENGLRLRITLSDSNETYGDQKYFETLLFSIE